MTYIHSINHSNKNVTSKVNYFANYYSFVVSQLGNNSDFEIENILSLVEKVIFQLEMNNKEESHVNYVKNYFEHEYLNPENKYFKEYKNHHRNISKLIYEFTSIDNTRKKNWIKENKTELIISFKKFNNYLKKYMFKKALNSIISFLKCKHKLSEHQEDLKHFTNLIAVELFYDRSGKDDIKDLFNKIMTRDIDNFPFDPIFIKKNSSNLKKAKESFMSKRSFDEQFEGIMNFFKKEEIKKYYIFRVGNIDCENGFSIKFKEIEFNDITNRKIKKLIKLYNKNNDSFMPDFFSSDYKLFIIVESKSKIENNAHSTSLKKATEWLNKINTNCKINGIIDDRSYLFTNNFKDLGWSISLSNNKKKLLNSDISKISSASISEYLYDKKLKSKEEFLKHNETYIKAKADESIDEYWRYLENMLEKPVMQKFKKIISSIISNFETQHIDIYIKNCLSQFNINSELTLGLTFKELREVNHNLYSSDNYDYNLIKNKIKNEFLVELIDYREQISFKNNYDIYLDNIITNTYEHRNFIQHNGNSFYKTDLKLKTTLPQLIIILRQKLLQTMTDNPDKNLKEIIHSLTS